jgi:ABC-type sugar transport system ATPase subunit
MDEPLSNLDAQLRLHTRGELKRLHQQLGTTMVYVTHDQAEAMTLGTRIAIMRHGAIVQAGAPMELYRRPVNTFVATFLGSPPMNLIDGTRNGGRITIGVRPEDVLISAARSPGDEEALPTLVERLGNESLLTVEYRGQPLVARVPSDLTIEPGRPVWIRMPPDRVLTFDTSTGNRID